MVFDIMAKVDLIGVGGSTAFNPDAILSSLVGEVSRVVVIYVKDGDLHVIQSEPDLYMALGDVTRVQHSLIKHLEG
mgnify:CR=1 FL=1